MTKRIKTGGRDKGTPNKITAEIRDAYKDLIEKNLSNIDTWLQETAKNHPDKALIFLVRLSDFVIPKLQNIEFTSDLERLTDEQLDYIINELKENVK